MEYFRPDPVNTLVIHWATRITIVLSSTAIVALVASIAIKAIMALGSSIVALIEPLAAMIGNADPIVQLSLEIVVCCVFVAFGIKLFRAIAGTREVRGAM